MNRGGVSATRPSTEWERRTGSSFRTPDAPSSLRTLTQQNASATRTNPLDRAPAGSRSRKDYAPGFGGGDRNRSPGFSFTRDDDHFTAGSVRFGDRSLSFLHHDDDHDFHPLHLSSFGRHYWNRFGRHHHHHDHYPYFHGYYGYYSPLYWPGYWYTVPRYGYSYASVYFGTPYVGEIYTEPYYAPYVDTGYVNYDTGGYYDGGGDTVIYGDDVYVNGADGQRDVYIERDSEYGSYSPPAMPAPSAPSAAPPGQELEPFGDRGTPYGEAQPPPPDRMGEPTDRDLQPQGSVMTDPSDGIPQGPPVDEQTGWGPVLSKGNDAFAAGDYEEAKRLYIQAIMVDERDGYAKMLYAWANFALRDYELAATSIRRALLTTQDLMQYPLDVRSMYKDVNVFEAQLRDLQKHVFDKPEDREAKLLLAYLYFSIGEPERSEAFLAELADADGGQDQTVKQLREASVKAQEILKSRQQAPQGAPQQPQPSQPQ